MTDKAAERSGTPGPLVLNLRLKDRPLRAREEGRAAIPPPVPLPPPPAPPASVPFESCVLLVRAIAEVDHDAVRQGVRRKCRARAAFLPQNLFRFRHGDRMFGGHRPDAFCQTAGMEFARGGGPCLCAIHRSAPGTFHLATGMKERDAFLQSPGLRRQFLGSRRHFLGRAGVLLGHLVELLDRLVDLIGADVLLAAGGADLLDQFARSS